MRKLLYIFILLSLSHCKKKDPSPGFTDYGIGELIIEEDGLPAKPPLSVQQQHSVYDYAGLLKPVERRQLEQRISKYYDSTTTQIVIATIVSGDFYSIDMYATHWAEKWGIGQKGRDNGIFILVSKSDRLITIRTGYGVEDKLTDAKAKRIIEQDVVPKFKKEKYYEGLDAAVTGIQEVLAGKYVLFKDSLLDSIFAFGIGLFLVGFFFAFIYCFIAGFFGKCESSGTYSSSGSSWSNDSSSSSWGSSGGSSYDSGGGFSNGFGGGSFGGGGATGSW